MYVIRNSDGEISGVFKWPVDGVTAEQIDDDSPELLTFLNPAINQMV